MAPPATQPVWTVHRADDFVTIDRTTKIFSGDGRCKQNPSAVGHSETGHRGENPARELRLGGWQRRIGILAADGEAWGVGGASVYPYRCRLDILLEHLPV